MFLLLGSIYEKHAEVFRVPCMYSRDDHKDLEREEGRGKNGDQELFRMGDNLSSFFEFRNPTTGGVLFGARDTVPCMRRIG